ncbi:hypothetical protein MMC22_004567 [Lobaria immixta]|nr:hypothetical protein [Lobaria immixta]
MTSSEGTANGSHDTVTVTKGTDLKLLPSCSRSPGNLSNEVLLMIFKLLDKDHLKSVRCACKFFGPLASPLLFDQIYISPHRPNLDVFRHMTEHSELCRYPRELVYDVQRFKATIDSREYFKNLCDQLRHYTSRDSRFNIPHVDKEIEGLVGMARGPPREDDSYSTCRVVLRGLEIYRQKAEEEDYYSNSGQLLACLCVGLVKLPYLDKVMFQSTWEDGDLFSENWSESPREPRLFSSPLARAWSSFHLKPVAPSFDANTVHEFDNVISAFSLTKRPLRALHAGSLMFNMPYEKFYTKSRLSRTFRQHGPTATHHLECLQLDIDTRHYSARELSDSGNIVFTRERTPPVDLLAAAFLHMPGLRHLWLSSVDHDDGNGLLSISELFQAVRLPALEHLSLWGMLGSVADILAFLRAQSRLRTLELCNIELSEGTWAGLVDDMRRCLSLESVNLIPSLRQGGGVDIWDEDAWEDENMTGEVEKYILHGGTNPLRVPE